MAKCLREDDGACRRCDGELDFDFTMAYQPIIDLDRCGIFGYEALVRGIDGAGAKSVLDRVQPATLYRFDQSCRVRALEVASRLNCTDLVSINFLPNAVYEPSACIQATLEIADALDWPLDRIMFEVTETEYVRDRAHLYHIMSAYREMGFMTAIDDFGAGFANLELMIDLRPDILKIDRGLIDHVDEHYRKQALVDSIILLAERLDIRLLAEGIEREEEAAWLFERGVTLQQGYYYARPGFESLPSCESHKIAAARGERETVSG